MSNVPIAREEFTNYLDYYLIPLITQGFNSMYLDARELCKSRQRENETIKQFQIFLKRIPEWNNSILEKETNRIKGECEFIMKIVTAIFTSYVQILSSIRLREKNSSIKIKIPMCDIFIHKIYINSAEQIFKEPKIFKLNVSPELRSKNEERIEEIIKKSIEEAISSSLPLENILQEYIGNIYEDEDIESKIEEENEDEDEDEESDGASVYYEEGEGEEENESDDESIEDTNKVISFGDKITEHVDPFQKTSDFKESLHEENEEEEPEEPEPEEEPEEEEEEPEEESDIEPDEEEEEENENENVPLLETGPSVEKKKFPFFDKNRINNDLSRESRNRRLAKKLF